MTSAVEAGQVEAGRAGSPGHKWLDQVCSSGVPTPAQCTPPVSTQYLHNIYTISTQYLHSVSAVDTQRGGDNVSGAAQWGRGSAGLVTM